jgi:HSP20 family protein
MTQMTRWDPFGEFGSIRRAMDRLLEDYTPIRGWRGGEMAELTFPVDVRDNGNEITVKAVLPGIKPEDVEITVTEGVLTIRGESREETKDEKENYYRREIRYGSFARSVPLPTRVKEEHAEAEVKDGMLTVHLPKAEEVRPRQIAVKPASSERELVGSGNRSSN